MAQGLITRPYATPAEAVAAHGAMQGQDLPGVIASAALRTPTADPAAVIADLDAGRLVRGYPMRGTVFLMAADDVLWVQELCNPAMLRAQASRRSQLELGDHHVERASEVTGEVLAHHPRGLDRASLMQHWNEAGIETTGGRGYHVLSYLIGRGEVVFGPWNGSDQNVVPRSWLPEKSDLEGRFNGDPIAATADLLGRYLTSHGPASLRDFAWWTKLPQARIKPAFASIEATLERFDHSAQTSVMDTLWCRPGLHAELAELDELSEPDKQGQSAARPLLLPGFDEFILGYRDRLFATSAEEHALLVPGNNGVFKKTLVRDGRAVGIWTRAGRPGKRTLEMAPFGRLTKAATAQWQALFEQFPFLAP